MDKVQTLDGQVLESTVGGIYAAYSMNGIAVTTEYAAVASAAGLSAEQVAAGTNVKFYFCDSYVKEEKAALSSATDVLGKQVAAYINTDMYTIDKVGIIRRVRETSEEVTLVLGLPKRFINSNNTFSIIGIKPNGDTVILEVLDTDPNTITVNTQFLVILPSYNLFF